MEDEKIEFLNNSKLVKKRIAGKITKKSRVIKIITLVTTIFAILLYGAMFLENNPPGHFSEIDFFLVMLAPFIWVFFPVNFIILSLRYSREKSNMDPLDKITFYILLGSVGTVFFYAISALFK